MTRQLTQYEKNLLKHNWENAAQKASTVTSAQIESRLMQQHELLQAVDQMQLQADLQSNLQLMQFSKQHCNKTGKFIRRLPITELQSIANIHGVDKTVDLLAVAFCQQYCVEWLATDNVSLHQLSVADPCSYWIYASQLVVKPFSQLTTNQGTATNDDFNDLVSLIDSYQSESKLQPELQLETKQSFTNRLDAQIDRIMARDYCEQLPAETLIESNELLRRAIGLISPQILNREMPVEFQTLSGIAGDLLQFQQFNDFLKTAIANVIRKHASAKKTAICNADIANLKAMGRGWTNFASQKTLHGANQADSFAFDIRDFTVSDYQAAIQPKKLQKPQPICNPVIEGAVLKLGGNNSARSLADILKGGTK